MEMDVIVTVQTRQFVLMEQIMHEIHLKFHEQVVMMEIHLQSMMYGITPDVNVQEL
jgi:hypothetical protein